MANARTPNDGKILIYPRINKNKLVITMARKIRGTKTYEPKGIIAVDLEPSYLTRSWGEITLDENSFFMIVGNDGQIIYHPNNEYMGKEIKQSIKDRLANKSENNFYEEWNNEKVFFHFNTSSYTGWKVVLAVPQVTLFEPITVVRTTVFISGAIAIIIALFLASISFGKLLNQSV